MNLEDEQTNEYDFYCNISCTVFFFVAEVIHLQLPTNYYNEENSREQKTKQKKPIYILNLLE